MSDESQSKSSFVVKDKRRFDMEGNEKQGDEAVERPKSINEASRPEATHKPQPANARDTHSQAGADFSTSDSAGEHGSFDFSSFIISLGTQALMQLGAMPPPAGVSVPVDKEAAKQTIEILTMLQQKTRGNLDKDEERLLQEILHNVRLSYVRAVA